MTNELQTILALGAVGVAFAYLVWRAWKKSRSAAQGSCGGADEGCGCSAKLKVPPSARPR